MLTKERKGLSALTTESGYDILGAESKFRGIVSQLVKKTVKGEGKWFTFCTRVDDAQKDIMSITNNQGIKIGRMIADEYPDSEYRTAIYKYLFRDFLVYYEAPTIIRTRDSYASKASYDKFIGTSCIEVAALWAGMSIEDAKKKWEARVKGINYDDDGDPCIPYLKLHVGKDGTRKVSSTRKDLDLSKSGTRVIPLFALRKGVNCLYKLLSEDTYDVEFLKDGGAKRIINTTFNVDKIREIYKNEDQGLLTEDIGQIYDGDFMSNKSIERGYIRVFELGTNLKSYPMRSINYARIISFKKAEPDLAYININLDKVISTFTNKINVIKNLNVKEFVDALDAFNVGSSRKIGSREIKTVQDIETWVEQQEMLLSTPFIKQLAMFMIGFPQWFGNYTGQDDDSFEKIAENYGESNIISDKDLMDLDIE